MIRTHAMLVPATGLVGLGLALACAPSAPCPAANPSPPTASTGAPTTVPSVQPTSEAPPQTTPPPSKSGAAGAMCGGIAGFGCAANLYCDFPLDAHCGAADQTGVCKPIAEMCTEQYAPVCGCNDKTYANACFAARDGVSVASQGECAPSSPPPLAEGQLCGTRGVQGACGADLYCKFKSECGATDAGGSCVVRPKACTKIYKPVCGCDGKTYPSDCVAASQGVDVQHNGACPDAK